MKPLRFLLSLACLLLLLGTATAHHQLRVTRTVRLYEEATSASQRIRTLDVGEIVTATASPMTNDYVEVTTDQGEQGWVYRYRVTVIGTTDTGTTPAIPTSSPLELHVINVGQGDANYIRCPDGTHQLLIDAGDNRYPGSAQAFQNYITSHHAANDPIEVVVASHPHADHIGSMDWLVNNYTIGTYVDDGMPSTTATWGRLETALSTHAVSRWSVLDDVLPNIDFCPRADVNARVLKPQGFGHDSDPNNNSVIVRVDMGADSFLFVGDCEEEEERLLLDDPATLALLDCNFLKVGHHASDTSTKQPFVDAVTPEICSVSVGAPGVGTNSTYMHPRAVTLNRLLAVCGPRQGASVDCQAYASGAWGAVNLNRALYATVVDGDLLFRSAGNGIQRVTTP